jgi:hypothetical protein
MHQWAEFLQVTELRVEWILVEMSLVLIAPVSFLIQTFLQLMKCLL